MAEQAERTKEVLDVQEAADLLGVSVWTMRDAANKGEVPARKVGRAWRFSRQALLEWLEGGDREKASAI